MEKNFLMPNRFFLSRPIHCVISAQTRSFFWFLFSRDPKSSYSVRIRENRKYGPEKTPYLDTFHIGIPTLMLIFTMILKSFKIISIDSIWLLTVTDRTMVRREKHANEFSFSVLPVCYTQKEAQVKWGLASLQNFSSKMKQFMHMDLTTIGFITIIYLKSRLYLVCAVALYTISEGFLTS